jgi:Arc/MetJ family transcription regulator
MTDMTKRLIEIDDELLESAKQELGTTGIADTVRTALQLAAARSARLQEVEWLRSGGMAELASKEARDRVWR